MFFLENWSVTNEIERKKENELVSRIQNSSVNWTTQKPSFVVYEEKIPIWGVRMPVIFLPGSIIREKTDFLHAQDNIPEVVVVVDDTEETTATTEVIGFLHSILRAIGKAVGRVKEAIFQ